MASGLCKRCAEPLDDHTFYPHKQTLTAPIALDVPLCKVKA